ncbi:deSI-like protein At4g17486 isoform X2 [Lathyrus oleraceus]|uniref:deSI-like protein At4g17486 isoform X2 n=1 Tax=Pisum sativum TaxID=3888 RepID=UPI0021CF2D45|nr:deSI-like protein At4g17486 isoform X2 [Pisum sativum]
MGAESASSSLQYEEDDNSSKNNSSFVVLNVYDLTPMNNYIYWFGLGIFHSGIEVYGKEYGFGAHDFSASGVFEAEPKTCPGFIYRCSIILGQIHISPSEFRTFIESMASEYHGDTYHLISKNCNHFTNDVSYRLIGKQTPGWVNRLAKLEDELADSLSTATPYRSQETDDEQEKHLLSSSGAEDVTFIKESHVK